MYCLLIFPASINKAKQIQGLIVTASPMNEMIRTCFNPLQKRIATAVSNGNQ